MNIERISSDSLIVAKLPDGSMALFNRETGTVYSLNTTAAAAWEACSTPTTISDILESMRATLGAGITEEVTLDALEQLQQQGLLKSADLPSRASRRSAIALAAGILAPVILTLTSAEQRAFATGAASPSTTAAATTGSPP